MSKFLLDKAQSPECAVCGDSYAMLPSDVPAFSACVPCTSGLRNSFQVLTSGTLGMCDWSKAPHQALWKPTVAMAKNRIRSQSSNGSADSRGQQASGSDMEVDISGDTTRGCICCGKMTNSLFGMSAKHTRDASDEVCICAKDRAALGRHIAGRAGKLLSEMNGKQVWKQMILLASLFKLDASTVPGFRPGHSRSCMKSAVEMGRSSRFSDGSDADSESGHSGHRSLHSDSDDSDESRAQYDPVDSPFSVIKYSALPWDRWHRMHREVNKMEAGSRMRRRKEDALLAAELDLVEVQLKALDPLQTRASVDLNIDDWAAQAVPKTARRERQHLRELVLGKGLIMHACGAEVRRPDRRGSVLSSAARFAMF